MAEEVQGVLAVELRAKLEGLKQDLGKVKPLLQDTEKAILTTGQKWTQAGASIMKVGAIITGAVTVPLIAMASSALKAFASFEQAMAGVKAVSGATGQEFKKLTDLAKELGATTKFTAVEAAEGMVMLGRAGMTANEILAAMPGLLKLAAAGAVDLGTAADIVSDVMMAFGADMGEAGRYADVFAQAAASANTTVEALGQAMAYAAPAAAAAGLSVEQTAAALSALADAGIKGSRAGTTMDAVMRELRNRVVDGKLDFDAFTVSVYDNQGAMRDLFSILGDIEEGMKGMTQEQRDAALGMNFTTRALRGMNVWLVRGVDDLRALEDGLITASGAAGRMADIMMDTLQGATIELSSAVEGLKISFGEYLAPAAEDIVRKLTNVVRWLTNLDDAAKQNILVWAGIAASIGPVITALGFLAVAIGLVLHHWVLLTTAILPVMALLLAVGGVIALIADQSIKSALEIAAASITIEQTVADSVARIEGTYAETNRLILLDQMSRHIESIEEEIAYLEKMGHTVDNSPQLREAHDRLNAALLKEQRLRHYHQLRAEKEFLDALAGAPDVEALTAASTAYLEAMEANFTTYYSNELERLLDFYVSEGVLAADQAIILAEIKKAALETANLQTQLSLAEQLSLYREAGYENNEVWSASAGEFVEITKHQMDKAGEALREADLPEEAEDVILAAITAMEDASRPAYKIRAFKDLLAILDEFGIEWSTGLEYIGDDTGPKLEALGDKFVDIWGGSLEEMPAITAENAQQVNDTLQEILGDPSLPIELHIRALAAAEAYGKGIEDGDEKAIDAAGKMIQDIIDIVESGEIGVKMFEVGELIPDGLEEGMSHYEDALIVADKMIDDIERSIKRRLKVESPSKLMADIGKSIPEGLAQGISGNIDAVINAILDVVKQVTEKFSGIVKDMIDISKESVTNTVKAFSELPGKLLTVLNDVFTKVKQFRNDMLSTFFRIAADAVKEFLRAMKDFPNSVWNILKHLISRIISSGREFYWAAFNLARRIWEGFKAGLGIRSPSYIEKAMDNILKQTRNSVADLKNVLNSLDDISGPKIFANNIVQASDISAMNASDIGNAVAKAITSIINNSGHKDGKDVILTINGRELARALVPFTAAENMRIATK